MTDLQSGVIFPVGQENTAYAKYFVGKSYLNMLSMNPACPIGNVTFEPGCRNNWHIHAGGQILLITGGKGWYQAEGQEARALFPGDVVDIPGGVKHWHGAAKDSWFVHIAVEVQPDKGPTQWLEPVDANDYENLK